MVGAGAGAGADAGGEVTTAGGGAEGGGGADPTTGRGGALAVGAVLARPFADVAPAAVGPTGTEAEADGTTGSGAGVLGCLEGAGGGGGGWLRRTPLDGLDAGFLAAEAGRDRCLLVSDLRLRTYALEGGREACGAAAAVSPLVLLVLTSATVVVLVEVLPDDLW